MGQPITTILRTPIAPGTAQNQPQAEPLHSKGNAFGKLLQSKIAQADGISLSGHASDRIRQRGLDVTETDLAKLSEAVTKADAKGAKDTLFLMKDNAFLVNIKNRVIVTVIDQQKLKDDIFTNIDSVAIVPKDGEQNSTHQSTGQDLLARMPLAR